MNLIQIGALVVVALSGVSLGMLLESRRSTRERDRADSAERQLVALKNARWVPRLRLLWMENGKNEPVRSAEFTFPVDRQTAIVEFQSIGAGGLVGWD